MKALEFSKQTKVVLIGVDKFREERLPDLLFPGSSAQDFRSALIAEDGCDIPADSITCLSDKSGEIHKHQIVNALSGVAEDSKEDEILIVFYAGHGVIIDEEFYLCTTDGVYDETQKLLSGTEISRLLLTSQFRGILFIIDCCQGAGFAERNPSFFQSSGNSEFRILLSSAAEGQNSYEFRDIKGTIFSKILIDVCAGKIQIGKVPGEIYFLDLLNAVRDGIDEELRVRRQLEYNQTPVFFGAFSRDPLLFLHKKLSLEQLNVQLARFSPNYVKKRVRAGIATVLALSAILIGSYYTFLDRSRYLSRPNDNIAIMRGHPTYTGFGFPKLVWETDILAASLPSFSGQETITLDSNESAEPFKFLAINLKSPDKELLLLRRGERMQALKQLRKALKHNKIEASIAGGATQLFAQVATKADIPLLEQLTTVPRVDVQIGAYEALMRLTPARAYDLLLSRESLFGNRDFVRRLLPALDYYVQGQTENLLEKLTLNRTSLAGLDPHFVAALRLKAHVSDEMLWSAILESPLLYDTAAARYLIATNRYQAWLQTNELRIRKIIDDRSQNLDAARMLYFLAVLPSNTLELNFTNYIDSDNKFVQTSAALAALRYGQIQIEEIGSVLLQNESFLRQYTKLTDISGKMAVQIMSNIDPSTDGLGTAQNLLNSLSGYLTADAIPFLKTATNYEDPNDISGPYQAYALRELCRLNSGFDAKPFLSRESSEVIDAAVKCIAITDEQEAQGIAVRLLKSNQSDLARDILFDIGVSDETLKMLSKIVQENSDSSLIATQVLVVSGTQEQAIELISSPSAAIRDQAIEFIGGHAEFKNIMAIIKNDKSEFGFESLDKLLVSEKWHSKIDEAIDEFGVNIGSWIIETEAGFQSPPRGVIFYLKRKVDKLQSI